MEEPLSKRTREKVTLKMIQNLKKNKRATDESNEGTD